jgi:hypothetical protein
MSSRHAQPAFSIFVCHTRARGARCDVGASRPTRRCADATDPTDPPGRCCACCPTAPIPFSILRIAVGGEPWRAGGMEVERLARTLMWSALRRRCGEERGGRRRRRRARAASYGVIDQPIRRIGRTDTVQIRRRLDSIAQQRRCEGVIRVGGSDQRLSGPPLGSRRVV